jgi:hypothetical protein
MNANWDPEDTGLREAVAVLSPTRLQIARVQAQVEARVEREGVPLLQEWLGLLRQRPLAHGGLALVGALAVLATTPLGSLVWALLRVAAA